MTTSGGITDSTSLDPADLETLSRGRPAWLFLVCCLALILGGCSTPPAALHHLAGAVGRVRGKETAAQTLDVVAFSPESAAGKSAARRFFELWDMAGYPQAAQIGRWKVSVTSEWKAGYFDEFLPAANYDVRGLRHRYVREGGGVALVGCRKNAHRESIERLYPPEVIARPVTAVFTRGPGDTITVALKDPMRHAELAADFSAPLAKLLGQTTVLSNLGVGGLIGSREAERRGHALYLMEPYDPHKVPVVFVHGLLSTPLAWANLTNELWGDPGFRRRYQIWHYYYPTSAPFLYSAKMFRQRIAEVRQQLDPRGAHPASAQLEIVAHSMGGLLTRTLITDSGEEAWDNVFRMRPELLKATPEDRTEVTDILHWKARRDVRHVIFVAVPHRGSEMSRGIIGRVGSALTGLPANFTALYARLYRDNPEALQPAFRERLPRGTLTSIDTLSPRHPLLKPLNGLPFAPWVTVHSIIGNRGRKGPLALSSDGVVPYSSSHLDVAVSELVVPTDHGAYEDPQAVAEILRILNGSRVLPPRAGMR